MFVAGALLLIAVAGSAAFFVIREPGEPVATPNSTEAPTVDPPERPPLNVNGVVLRDGPKIDPTDVIFLVRARLQETESPHDMKLMGIAIHRAHESKVDLDDAEAWVTYDYLLSWRNPRAAKVEEHSTSRLKLTLRSDAPAVQKSEEGTDGETVPDPTCVWNAAWRAAIASGLSAKDHLDVTYGPWEGGKGAVWIFEVPGRPDTRRVIDGRSCAIKLSPER